MYEFRAGAPTPDGEEPDFEAAEMRRWRVTLKRGQKTWILLDHQRHSEHAGKCAQLALKRGAYQLVVEFVQPEPTFIQQDTISPQHTGFEMKYAGPDSEGRMVTIPLDRLYRDRNDEMLSEGIDLDGAARSFLELHFTSSLRGIRRTYQRAFKALLFAHHFGLSAKPIEDYGQSEIGYILDHPDDFAGRSYYRQDGGFNTHLASFDFNFLPLLDTYHPPTLAQDARVQPSVKRQQALFDWWERIFDYDQIRKETQPAREHPLWLLFDEAAEKQPDNPAPLLRHMGVDLTHAALALQYYQAASAASAEQISHLSSDELGDERWPVRVWQIEKWLRDLLSDFAAKDIRDARPDLWALDDPGAVVKGE